MSRLVTEPEPPKGDLAHPLDAAVHANPVGAALPFPSLPEATAAVRLRWTPDVKWRLGGMAGP